MTTDGQITLSASERTAFGNRNRALRRSGFTPLHVYGHGEPSLALQADSHDVVLTISRAGRTTPLTVHVDGGDEHFVMVREVQRNPVTDALVHVDLLRISRTERVRVAVPIHIEGEAPAARGEDLALSHDLYEVEVLALPLEVPNAIVVDVSAMETPDAAIHVSDLDIPSGVEVLTDPDTAVVRIVTQRVAAVEEGEPAEAATEPDAGAPPAEAAGDGEEG